MLGSRFGHWTVGSAAGRLRKDAPVRIGAATHRRRLVGRGRAEAAKLSSSEQEVSEIEREVQDMRLQGKLGSLTVRALQGFLRAQGLKTSGTKAEVIQRIEEYFTGTESLLNGAGASSSGMEEWDVPVDGFVDWSSSMRRPDPQAPHWKLVSWNVNGLRSLLKHEDDPLRKLLEEERPDVLCLQETKLKSNDIPKIMEALVKEYPEYNLHCWNCSNPRLGYSGTAIFSRVEPIGNPKYDFKGEAHSMEGRTITLEFSDFFLVNAYVPNSGQDLARLSYRTEEWDRDMREYMNALRKRGKPIVFCGDMNVARTRADIHNAEGNLESAGFTEQERNAFSLLLGGGLRDVFREQHPQVRGYTYWSYRFRARQRNMGWRIDYFLVSPELMSRVYDSYILEDTTGSDHCPVGITMLL